MVRNAYIFIHMFLIIWVFSLNPEATANILQADSTEIFMDSIQVLKDRGIHQAQEGELAKAHKTFQQELSLKQKIFASGNPKIGDTYVNIGVVYKMQGKMDRALEYYNKAEHIYTSDPKIGVRKTATNYQNMANIYSMQKDYEKARNYYQRALELLKKDSAQNIDRLGMVYNNLGILMKKQGNFNEAISYYEQSIRLKKKTNKELLSSSYGNLANLKYHTNQLRDAEKYFNKAINSAMSQSGKDNYGFFYYFMNYGLLKLKQNEFHIAKNLLNKSLKILHEAWGKVHPETSRCYENLGYLYIKQDNPEKALTYYQKGLLALSPEFTDSSLYANPDIEKVFSKTQLLNLLKRKALALTRLESNRKKNFRAALKTYDLALEVIRQLRTGYQSQESKLSLTAEERNTYLNALQTALRLYRITDQHHYLEQAFRYAEAGKAAVLYESMQSSQALKLGNIPDSLREQENKLKKRIWTYEELIFEERKKQSPDQKKIDYWNEQMFGLQKEYEALVNKFEQQYPRYYSLKYNQEVISLPQVQKKMRRGETLVEYALGRDSIYTFQIEKKQARLYSMASDTALPQKVLKLRNFLSNRNFSNHGKENLEQYQVLAHEMYAKLIEPLDLQPGSRLTIIPDDVLAYIPFEILISKKQSFDRVDYSDLSYLMREHQIGYSYSAKVLFNKIPEQNGRGHRLAAFAPTYENIEQVTKFESPTRQQYREKLYPLKGIKKEARRITDIIRGDVYSDYEATEARFKESSGDYDILHLAMHTLVDDHNPMYSKMAFTQEKNSGEDGFLNTYEIYSMNLDSRMAVLSSCNTGTGKLEKGEGVISLARGFKYAGCPSIVMTMWPVEDNSSIRLMEYFYQAISKGKSKDEALREAKLRFLENADPLHAHPYFWAGYILIGDQSSLYTPGWIWWSLAGALVLVVAGVGVTVVLRRRRFKRTF